MKPETRQKLIEAEAYCDEHDKSTEFMIQYMQDYAGVDHDCVIKFLMEDNSNMVQVEIKKKE